MRSTAARIRLKATAPHNQSPVIISHRQRNADDRGIGPVDNTPEALDFYWKQLQRSRTKAHRKSKVKFGAETDVQMTADEVLLLRHDADVKVLRDGNEVMVLIKDLTFAELNKICDLNGEQIWTLKSALPRLAKLAYVDIEIKGA